MSNVVPFTRRKQFENPLDPQTVVSTAIANILTATLRLAGAIREFSRHIDVIDRAIGAIDDIESRNRLRRSLKRLCERLKDTLIQLSQEIRKLPACPTRAD